ncbi:MAG: hypothetical protein HYU57_07625 [Micavibrio aeruginosavorus]|nr:hypothetical protein [Micavibrio aeruginosavorus]
MREGLLQSFARRRNRLLSAPLRAVFLASAVMAAGGCDDATVLLQRNPESIRHMTGEERYETGLRFHEIAQFGDDRLKRLVLALRQSEGGRELYDYAAAHNPPYVEWQTMPGQGGGYSWDSDNSYLKLNPRLSDENLFRTLVHELRHHWQNTALGTKTWVNSPLRDWELKRFSEADACAYTAHFGAAYAAETGNDQLTGGALIGYGDKTSRAYSRKPPSERDYLQDAFVACMEEQDSNYLLYSQGHYLYVKKKSELIRQLFDHVDEAGEYAEFYKRYLDVPGPEETARRFSQFLTPSLNTTDVVPAVKAMSSDAFLGWVKQVTTGVNADYVDDIDKMEKRFNMIRNSVKTVADTQGKSRAMAAPGS